MAVQWFYDPRQFAFTVALEENWHAILREYEGIRADLIPWHERKLCEEGWRVYAIFGFPQGEPIADHVSRCPVTAELVGRHIPQHGAAGFSVLAPHTRIHPHQGYQGDVLRCHLGLQVPEGDVGLRIETESRRWQAGRVMVFDDRFTHEAWNMTDQERVVLLVDFVPSRTG